MELKNFISQALQDVLSGISDAQEKVVRGKVAPMRLRGSFQDKSAEKATIDFDIAVTVEDTTSKDMSGKISVFSIGGGASQSKEASVSTVSRIKFSITVDYPTSTLE